MISPYELLISVQYHIENQAHKVVLRKSKNQGKFTVFICPWVQAFSIYLSGRVKDTSEAGLQPSYSIKLFCEEGSAFIDCLFLY